MADLRRAGRDLQRLMLKLRSAPVTVRCPDCGRCHHCYLLDGPPGECPGCGRDVSDRWHEVTEG